MAPEPSPTRRVAVVAVGGMIGAALRYGSGRLAPVPAGAFPWSTFAVNVLGSLALGVLTTVTSAR